MNIKKSAKRARRPVLIITAVLIISLSVSAEDPMLPDISTLEPATAAEIGRFAEVMNTVEQINIGIQQEIDGLIEESSLTYNRFMEIYESEQSLGAENTAQATDSELAEFNTVMGRIAVIQENTEESMYTAISDAGLTVERFGELYRLIRNDPELMEQLRMAVENEKALDENLD